jgi:hypothetical protein
MDSDQTGNGPNQSEIEFLYNAALTAFVDCTGLEAKRDEALKNGIAKTKLLYEIVGADNWESLLKRKKIRRVGKTTGSFQPWVKHAMGVTSDEGGWVIQGRERTGGGRREEHPCKWGSRVDRADAKRN